MQLVFEIRTSLLEAFQGIAWGLHDGSMAGELKAYVPGLVGFIDRASSAAETSPGYALSDEVAHESKQVVGLCFELLG